MQRTFETDSLVKPSRPFQRCTRCLLDTVGDDTITFDAKGVCDYCHTYDKVVVPSFLPPEVKRERFAAAIAEVKAAGRGRTYDCIMGLSGGMDSSYVAHLAKVNGLRPLIVHLDNGWDAELAVRNIENIIQRTGFDYYNYVIDWEEFKDMQLAYLKASVIDTEVVTDQAIFAILHIVADRLGVRNILFGDNPKTERVMPRGWTFTKNDLANMRAIHRRFGTRKMRSYPFMGKYDLQFYRQVRDIRYVRLMHYIDADVGEIAATLEREFDWRNYRWKHCESVFTQFYQGYILPRKYAADKRKAHLSDLVLSGQITREEGLRRLDEPYYLGDALRHDYDYVLRKFGLAAEEFEELMKRPPVPHEHYPTETLRWYHWRKLHLWQCGYGLIEGIKGSSRQLLGQHTWGRLKQEWIRRIESNLDSRMRNRG